MRRLLVSITIWAILCCLWMAVVCSSASAELFSAAIYGEQIGPPNSFKWKYTLVNTSADNNYVAWLMAIAVDEGTEVLNVMSPKGWSSDTSIPSFITWMGISGNVPAGNALGGFVAEFSKDPGVQTWSIMFVNLQNSDESPVEVGSVITPEPGTFAAIATGLIALGGALKRRR